MLNDRFDLQCQVRHVFAQTDVWHSRWLHVMIPDMVRAHHIRVGVSEGDQVLDLSWRWARRSRQRSRQVGERGHRCENRGEHSGGMLRLPSTLCIDASLYIRRF